MILKSQCYLSPETEKKENQKISKRAKKKKLEKFIESNSAKVKNT